MIAFIGSVFSPYYAYARRRGAGDPLHHCAVNIALYGEGGKRWALTERGRESVQRSRSSLNIGASSLTWDGDALTARIDEVTAPFPGRIQGQVRLYPSALTRYTVALDAEGRHRWWPIAPCARVEVALERPALRWSGAGYLDTNAGDEPLERGFTAWDWSRASLRRGAVILYETTSRDGGGRSIAIRCDPSGAVEDFAAPPRVRLPTTLWRMSRGTRADGGQASVAQTLEDSPFYARSVLSSRLLGEPVSAMHESLSLDRFRAGWVRLLLRFRMSRSAVQGRTPQCP